MGIRDRGNTDLLTGVADLELKMGCTCVGEDNLRDLTSVSQFVAEACNLSVPAHHPYTGASAFAHKGGLHASAIARFPEAYEHTRPESVGNVQRMLVSELAGKASLVAKARGLCKANANSSAIAGHLPGSSCVAFHRWQPVFPASDCRGTGSEAERDLFYERRYRV